MSCLINCRGVCAGVTCDQVHGGCQVNGVCLPSTPGACTYDAAADRTSCDLAGAAAGSGGGVWCYAFDIAGIGPKATTYDSYATNCN